MSFKEKFKSIIGIDEEEYEFEEFEEYEEEIEEPQILKKEQSKPLLKTVKNNKNNQKGSVTMNNGANSEHDLNKVIIREPNEYSDAQDIADCLKDNFPVFINLQRLEKSQAKRIVDFLSGTIYAVDGEIKRVGTNLFLCTPKSVETEGQISLQDVQQPEAGE